MVAKIYKPARTAMQSGLAETKQWILEFTPEQAREIDPLMGWTSSADMRSQIRIRFPTQEKAVAYAKRNGLAYRIEKPHERKRSKKSYSDNFRYGRSEIWTH